MIALWIWSFGAAFMLCIALLGWLVRQERLRQAFVREASDRVEVQVTARGGVRMLHDDRAGLEALGPVSTTRASHVEFDQRRQRWYVQSARTERILADDFLSRAEALAWEREYYSPSGKGWAEFTDERNEG